MSSARALGASLVLAALMVCLYLGELENLKPAGGNRWLLWPLVALGVWASDTHPVRIRNRKMSVSLSLTEIPVVVGVVFLRPVLTLAALSIGYLAAMIQSRRPPSKMLTALTAYTLAVSIGILAYYRWLGRSSPVGDRGWVVVASVVALMTATNLVLILLVMAVADRRWRRPPLGALLLQAGLYMAVCTAGGLVAVSLVLVNSWGIVLVLAIAVATNFAYRATVVSGQRYANLEKLYDFTRRLSSLVEGRDVMVTVLEQARTILERGAGRARYPPGRAFRPSGNALLTRRRGRGQVPRGGAPFRSRHPGGCARRTSPGCSLVRSPTEHGNEAPGLQ